MTETSVGTDSPRPPQLADRANRHLVARGEDGGEGNAVFEKSGNRLSTGFDAVIACHDEFIRVTDTRFLKRVAVALETLLCQTFRKRSGEMRDLRVPCFDQMMHGVLDAARLSTLTVGSAMHGTVSKR